MKRIYVWITIVMILGVGIIGASAYKSFYYDEKQEVTQAIDHYLKQQDYMTYVKNKEIRYDTSTGEFIAQVVFQDERKMNMRFIDRDLIALSHGIQRRRTNYEQTRRTVYFRVLTARSQEWK